MKTLHAGCISIRHDLTLFLFCLNICLVVMNYFTLPKYWYNHNNLLRKLYSISEIIHSVQITLAQALTLLTCTRKILSSSLDTNKDYTDIFGPFSWKCLKLDHARFLPQTSKLTLHYHSINGRSTVWVTHSVLQENRKKQIQTSSDSTNPS
jgi:hypothetical protein